MESSNKWSVVGPVVWYDSARPQCIGTTVPSYRHIEDNNQIIQNCKLLSLPFEVKKMIWEYVCLMANLKFIDRSTDSKEKGGLGFQLTCRMVYRETQDIMRNRVTVTSLHFTDLTVALNSLTTARMSPMIPALRRLRLPMGYFRVKLRPTISARARSVASLLQLLPGLELDVLALDVGEKELSDNKGLEPHATIGHLIADSVGWKQLRIICAKDTAELWSQRWIAGWQRKLKTRNGHQGSVFIQMFLERQPGVHALSEPCCNVFGDACPLFKEMPFGELTVSRDDDSDSSTTSDEGASSPALKPKDRQAHRGGDAIIVAQRRATRHIRHIRHKLDRPPYPEGHIRNWVGEKSWPEICKGEHLKGKT